MKRVAVQEDLVELKEVLLGKGYTVVDFNDRGHVDAIVYTNDYSGITNLNNHGDGDEVGAIIINAKDKGIEDIEYIIEKRRYGGLFT